MDLEPGQEVEVPDELAIRLINEEKVNPLTSWLIYSEILEDFLWAVPDEEARERLLSEGVTEVIYTESEIDLLCGASKDNLRMVYAAKTALLGSKVHFRKERKAAASG